MIANLISFMISYRLQREPIYEALAHQEGVFLPSGERAHNPQLIVASVMRQLSPDEEPAPGEHTEAEPQIVLHADQPLSVALEKMGAAHRESLPVVSRADLTKVLGVITLAEVLAAYGVEAPK